MDKNGEILAYNELAYSVKIEDIFESSSKKNRQLNEVVRRLIRLIEKNGDSVITDFKIIIDEDGEFAYSVEGTSRLRFLADVFGYATIDKLEEEVRELRAAVEAGKGQEEELGDLLLAVCGISYMLEIDPEAALHAACEKFIRRFALVEQAADGKSLAAMTEAELVALWKAAKQAAN